VIAVAGRRDASSVVARAGQALCDVPSMGVKVAQMV